MAIALSTISTNIIILVINTRNRRWVYVGVYLFPLLCCKSRACSPLRGMASPSFMKPLLCAVPRYGQRAIPPNRGGASRTFRKWCCGGRGADVIQAVVSRVARGRHRPGEGRGSDGGGGLALSHRLAQRHTGVRVWMRCVCVYLLNCT